VGELTLEAVDDGLRPAEAVSLTVVDDDVDVLTRLSDFERGALI
jgi:hypothetical protein